MMKYAKPEVAVLTPAISAIHGGHQKQSTGLSDSPNIPPYFVVTPNAYEADE